MGTLMFECPATGMEVSTGIEVDTASFESLSPLTADLPCPHCPPHTPCTLCEDGYPRVSRIDQAYSRTMSRLLPSNR
jgi:hypothetical protein